MRGRRIGADPRPPIYACALAAATAEGHGGRDQPDGNEEPQQQRSARDSPVRVSSLAAGTADGLLRARREVLAYRHLLARCQPGECRQQPGQLGVRTSEPVPDRVQGPLFPRVRAHRRAPHRRAQVATTSPAGIDGGVAECERNDGGIRATTQIIRPPLRMRRPTTPKQVEAISPDPGTPGPTRASSRDASRIHHLIRGISPDRPQASGRAPQARPWPSGTSRTQQRPLAGSSTAA